MLKRIINAPQTQNPMKILKFALLIAILLPLGTVNTAPASANPGYSVTATILDAYYTDADNGGIPNDVIVIIHFAIQGGSLNGLTYVVDLTLPSGRTFAGFVLIITNLAEVTTTNYFFNSALEKGWYNTSVHATLNGNPDISATDHMIFDPPGSDNSDSSGFGVKVN